MIESSNVGRALTSYALVALLAGCGGSSLTPGLPAAASHAARPPAPAGGNLLYVVSEDDPAAVNVYTYPGDQLQGQLTGFSLPIGDCTDKKGNVYVVDYEQNALVEYAHGGTQPIRTLPVPGSGPLACAVDRHGGDLAVTVAGTVSGVGAEVAIFHNAKGKPKTYTYAPIQNYAYCTYDDAGNLFVDGEPARGYGYDFELAELARGKTSLQAVSLQYGVPWGADLQWDGTYLAASQGVLPQILRYTIAGNYGTYAGSTPLYDAYEARQFVIVGKKAVVVNLYYVDRYITKWDVLVYNYPQGGSSTEEWLDSSVPIGSVALSRRPK